jgi:type IV pilus biogenesis/stability protein PilW
MNARRRFAHSWLPLVVLAGSFFVTSCSHLLINTKDQERAKLYLQRAAEEFNQRDYGKAIESAQTAIKLDPKLAAAYNHLALVYMETKRYTKAEEQFKKALDVQPEYPEVFNNLGVLLNREEKYQEAITYFKKAVADDQYLTPENAYTNMGYAYYRLGNLALSKSYHQRALDITPQFCLASKNMGDVYARERNFPKASDYFQRAVTNCPLYQEARYKLGLVLMKLGQKAVARTQL